VRDDGVGFLAGDGHSRALGQSLGLTIARRLVAAHGEKGARERAGPGTRIRFSLPMTAPPYQESP
jgi:signal transduction histidine kinase